MIAARLSYLLAVAGLAFGRRTPADMLTDNNYTSEVYTVRTNDSYYLRLDRLPNPGKPAVLLCNPILSSGAVFLHMGPEYALAYKLYKEGFDVFLGSDRGTQYSQDLTEKYNILNSPKLQTYFRFSFHEHGVLDNPAFIQKILEVSNQTRITYIGYSMSSCEYFAMVSTLPDYNGLIRSAHLMAPIMSLGPDSFFYKSLYKSHNMSREMLEAIGVYKFPSDIAQNMFKLSCPSSQIGFLCNGVLYTMLDSARPIDYVGNCPDLASTTPAGGSIPEFLHVAQNSDYPKRYKQYDHGVFSNILRYDSAIPPDYKLENIRIPTYTYRGRGDLLVTDEGVSIISSRVPGFKKEWMHPIAGFSHADFAWDHDAVSVYEEILKDMRRYLS